MYQNSYIWMETTHPLLLLMFALVALLIIFVPSIVAIMRDHPNRLVILVLNVLFGWTGLGWIILLVWAVTGRSHKYPLSFKGKAP